MVIIEAMEDNTSLQDHLTSHKKWRCDHSKFDAFVEKLLEELTAELVPDSQHSDNARCSYCFELLADIVDEVALLLPPGTSSTTK